MEFVCQCKKKEEKENYKVAKYFIVTSDDFFAFFFHVVDSKIGEDWVLGEGLQLIFQPRCNFWQTHKTLFNSQILAILLQQKYHTSY